jgi:thiamine-monophosphate kinase
MRLDQLGEFGFLERIRRLIPENRNVSIGIGDDAACVKIKNHSAVVTADLMLEGVHFDLTWTSFFDLGFKALAVNLSDIAAMGAIPAYLMLSLGIPVHYQTRDIEQFYKGIRSLAQSSGVALIGGDTSAADRLLISPCLIGHCPFRPITRAGAKEQNDIYVTGTLGDSALGLQLLKRRGVTQGKSTSYLINRHHRPTPRLATGALLSRSGLATAMIDISDGLLQDLGHICKASHVGARICEAELPLSAAYRALAGRDGTRLAVTGGEDYELLFCARRRDRAPIEKLQKQLGVPITRIGSCTSERDGISLLGNTGKPITAYTKGHDHFKRSRRLPLSDHPDRLRDTSR